MSSGMVVIFDVGRKRQEFLARLWKTGPAVRPRHRPRCNEPHDLKGRDSSHSAPEDHSHT